MTSLFSYQKFEKQNELKRDLRGLHAGQKKQEDFKTLYEEES